jgi:hypothetical protein
VLFEVHQWTGVEAAWTGLAEQRTQDGEGGVGGAARCRVGAQEAREPRW